MFRRVKLPHDISGQLYLHSMPGRHEQWADFTAEANRTGIEVIVCLAPDDEIKEKSPPYADAIQNGSLSWQRECFPIPDYSIPGGRKAFAVFLVQVAELLRYGKTILVHCGAGIGRTGTFAICLLLVMDVERMAAEIAVKDAGSYPETDEQKRLVDWCEKKFLAT